MFIPYKIVAFNIVININGPLNLKMVPSVGMILFSLDKKTLASSSLNDVILSRNGLFGTLKCSGRSNIAALLLILNAKSRKIVKMIDFI
ncbi:MAG: hypothetical protein NTY43_05050 [Bacteroidetes bacterium]|nr:hypothetical protein [Bacteroidota bacterium]